MPNGLGKDDQTGENENIVNIRFALKHTGEYRCGYPSHSFRH